MEEQKPKGSGMEKIATFIVDKRNLFFLLYAFALIFSIVATGWVKVENDITTYLPEDTVREKTFCTGKQASLYIFRYL